MVNKGIFFYSCLQTKIIYHMTFSYNMYENGTYCKGSNAGGGESVEIYYDILLWFPLSNLMGSTSLDLQFESQDVPAYFIKLC